MRFRVLFVALLALTGAGLANAREQVPAEERWWPYAAQLPGCDDPAVLDRIRSRFAGKESGYWSSSLSIGPIDHIRTTSFRPNGLDLIPRRYCRATAHLSNRRASTLYYSVIEDAGIIGYTYGVHFCLTAYDRNWANAPECKMARP
jgi:hypothetical protein